MTAISIAAVLLVWQSGWLLYYGDAESHLNHARRVLDSQTPGIDQFGTVWLPLPHLLMLPFAANDTLWHNGLAGAISSAICFVLAAALLFATTRRITRSVAPAAVSSALFALNPNVLYLQAIPMTEMVFFAASLGVAYFLVRFQESQRTGFVIGAGCAALAGSLTRYEGWILLPLTVVILSSFARRSRVWTGLLFLTIAAVGPFTWLAYNWWVTGNALEFYNGPYSPKAIQGAAEYPGQGDWPLAVLYLSAVARLIAGAPLFWLGCAGALIAVHKRVIWPVVLLAAPPLFIIWSLHSGGTPIQIPGMPFRDSWYNTRYGVSALPLLAFCAAQWIMLVRPERRILACCAVVLAAVVPWIIEHNPQDWIVWKESQVNSEARRTWTREAAAYLKRHFRDGDRIFTGSGDVNGVFREAGISFRQTLSVDNGLFWDAARLRPDLFLRCRWAIAVLTPRGDGDGDRVRNALDHARSRGLDYELMKRIASQDGKIIEIYRRAPVLWPATKLSSHSMPNLTRSGPSKRNEEAVPTRPRIP